MSHRWINLYFLLYAERKVTSKKEYCKSVGLCPQNFGAIEHDRQSVSMAVLCNTINKYGVRPSGSQEKPSKMLIYKQIRRLFF